MRTSPIVAVLALASASALSAVVAPAASAAGAGVRQLQSCSQTVGKGYAACFAVKLENARGASVDAAGRAITPQVISGKTPTDIRSAYKLAGLASHGRTVAIVDAYGYPNAERDLGVYRKQFGLPACTKANGCLTVMSQTGSKTALPAANVGWDQEQALDLDAVSAACPDCKILLVQANFSSNENLGAAVNTAARQAGVSAISNSYGSGDSSDASYGKYYNHPGIAITASTGDSGYQGASYPASSHYVTAVGGTSLARSSNARGWTESAWSGSGSGCAKANTAPSGQSSSLTHCSGRAMADVSAVADPSTGLAVYAPTSATASSWAQFGGTSLSSPIVASVYALSGKTTGYANTLPRAHTAGLFDVTSGRNGSCSYYCSAGTGWDGPTGLGTPNGSSAF